MTVPLKVLLRRQGQCNGGDCFGTEGSPTGSTTLPTTSTNPNDTDTDDDYWPSSDAGYITRYAVLAAIIVFILLWVILGIWHANRRLKRGQQPLWYHRWLVPNRYRRYPNAYPQQQWPNANPYVGGTQGAYGPPGQAYPMQPWPNSEHAPPPPVYTNDSPPNYVPPPGPPPGREAKGPDSHVSPVASPDGESNARGSAPSVGPSPGMHYTGPH